MVLYSSCRSSSWFLFLFTQKNKMFAFLCQTVTILPSECHLQHFLVREVNECYHVIHWIRRISTYFPYRAEITFFLYSSVLIPCILFISWTIYQGSRSRPFIILHLQLYSSVIYKSILIAWEGNLSQWWIFHENGNIF